MKHILLITLLLISFHSCKDDETCPIKEDPYELEVSEFELIETGNINSGCCGYLIIATSDIGTVGYKPIEVPSGITLSLDHYYKGIFEVLPEEIICQDCRFDSKPNTPSIKKNYHFIKILEWELKK